MKIAIIGAGFSGTMCAVNLARLSPIPLHIILIEKNAPGRGAAYKKADDCFLLNVRADQMGAFAENPRHFFEWLKEKKIKAAETDFLSRSLYGDYLTDLLKETQNHFPSMIEVIHDEVIDINPQTRTVFCKSNEFSAEAVVLSPGLETPDLKIIETLAGTTLPLTIIGTGLSMVDAVVYLEKHGYRGKITAVSRHGRLPHEHKFYPQDTPRPHFDFAAHFSLLDVLSAIKTELKKFEWRLVVDALRPHNQFLWSRWTPKEKSRFYRYCRSLWDVHRHRMSPEHKKILTAMMKEKRLEIKAAGYSRFTPSTAHVLELKGLSFDESKNALIASLMNKKIITKDFLGLGIESSPDGEIHGNWLFTLGPLRRGQLWECTAVPEIRKQARDLAARIIRA